MTRVLNGNNQSDIQTAAELIRAGGVVAFPTETVYGLGALGLSQEAVHKIYAAKNRPLNNPLILHVASLADAFALWDLSQNPNPEELAQRINTLAAHFWPGPLSIVCYRAKHVGDFVTADLNKVAVRIPNHPLAGELLKLIDAPVAAPSANLATRPSPTDAHHVQLTLNGKIDAVLDGGPCQWGLESTVVDVTAQTPVILRPGAISMESLRALFPTIQAPEHAFESAQASPSPGMQRKHYAPAIATVKLGDPDTLERAWKTDAAILLRQSTAVDLTARCGSRLRDAPTEILPDSPEGFAYELFRTLYRLEKQQAALLIIEDIQNAPGIGWHAIRDRLMRASG